MRKIPTLFVRDYSKQPALVTDVVTPGCEWVLAGEGVPTRKWDGTCTWLDPRGNWWARREVKAGKEAPDGFMLVQWDEVTGHMVGWEPIENSPFFKHFCEAANDQNTNHPGSTYELIGPKINGNPERVQRHMLVEHGVDILGLPHSMETFSEVKMVLDALDVEGVVWWHDDGRKAKLKLKDFGLRRSNT